MKAIQQILAEELNTKEEYIKNVIELLDAGSTIPFIARYRKEVHGSMDDTQLRKLEERLNYLRNLAERKETIRKAIEEQGKLTEELNLQIEAAMTQSVLEDLYRPYKQKRKTRASVAKERGLEPLAQFLLAQTDADPMKEAEKYIDQEKEVPDEKTALQGAMDIIAESISDDAENRAALREYTAERALVEVRAAKEEDSVYRQYYDFNQKLSKMKGYQVLALNRGEKEGFLKVVIDPDHEKAKEILQRRLHIKSGSFVRVSAKGGSMAAQIQSLSSKASPAAEYLKEASNDSYSRLIWPSLEREARSELSEKACEGAIANFAMNLKPLLMQPPVKGKVTMGLDPGYAHGCKVAVVDGTGKVLDTAVVYPTFNEKKKEEAIQTLSALIRKHGVEHIAIGNGTASRETEAMTAEMLERLHGGQSYAIVNEAGASVYSASKLGAEEFPDYDVNIRSAISIARRLQDPLAELVKIDPMSIGVGQYQHDMPLAQLEAALSGVVEDCVNAVGVDINSASPSLLNRVAGLSAVTAKNIVKYREENGAFKSRKEILKVPKIGPKAFEQCAGFLRIPESKEILDNTAVHPESYAAAKKLLALCDYTEAELKEQKLADIEKRIRDKGEKQIADACGVGVPTLKDIAAELKKPGRDPREELPPVVLRKDVLELKDLKAGMKLKGTVRNVMDFGAFVDIGVHQDGLVHISELADRFVKHPSEIVKVGDIVDVTVLGVDEEKKKISLSMKR